jgi:hypothetical protein
VGYLFPYHAAARAFAGEQIESFGAPLRYEAREIGELTISGSGFFQKLLKSGQLVAADPDRSNPPPFRDLIPAGTHPVTLAVAHLAHGARYVAYAKVRFSKEAPVGWRNAISTDADESNIRIGEQWGHEVSSRASCFMSVPAARLLSKRAQSDPDFKKLILDQWEANDALWVNVRPSPTSTDNVIAFGAGFGPGTYASCFGLDRNGQVTELTTDFRVSNASPGREHLVRLMRMAPMLEKLQREREAAKSGQEPE